MKAGILGCVLGSGVVLAALAAPAPAGVDESLERMMDRQARSAIESEYRVLDKDPMAPYVQSLGERLAEVSGRKGVKFVFKIIETDEINAVALPAGHVYVTTGLIEFVDSPEQLAAVIGHEVGHVAARHSLSSLKKAFWTDIFLGVLNLPSAVLRAGELGSTLYLLRHSRKDEVDADKRGAQYSLQAGFDPTELKRFMEKLAEKQEKTRSKLATYLSTHPDAKRRAARLLELPELDQKNPQVVISIARGYSSRHLPHEAIVRYRRALELQPESVEAAAGLTEAYAAVGEQSLARHEMERLREFAPDAVSQIKLVEAQAQGPAPKVTEEKIQAASSRLKQTIDEANGEVSAAKAANVPPGSLAKLNDAVSGKLNQVSRSLRERGQQERPESSEALKRVSKVLGRVRDLTGQIEEARRQVSEGAADLLRVGEELRQRLNEAGDGSSRAQALEWTDGYFDLVKRRSEIQKGVVEAASQAEARASQALDSLSKSLDTLSAAAVGQGFSGTARLDVETAEKSAADAVASVREAEKLRASVEEKLVGWRFDLDALMTSRPGKAQLDALIASWLNLAPEQVRAARQETGEWSSAVAKLVGVTQQEAVVASSPDLRRADTQGQQKQKGFSPSANLLLGLLDKAVRRELEARAEWKKMAAAS
jgi:predicted Zn-dependent protease